MFARGLDLFGVMSVKDGFNNIDINLTDNIKFDDIFFENIHDIQNTNLNKKVEVEKISMIELYRYLVDYQKSMPNLLNLAVDEDLVTERYLSTLNNPSKILLFHLFRARESLLTKMRADTTIIVQVYSSSLTLYHQDYFTQSKNVYTVKADVSMFLIMRTLPEEGVLDHEKWRTLDQIGSIVTVLKIKGDNQGLALFLTHWYKLLVNLEELLPDNNEREKVSDILCHEKGRKKSKFSSESITDKENYYPFFCFNVNGKNYVELGMIPVIVSWVKFIEKFRLIIHEKFLKTKKEKNTYENRKLGFLSFFWSNVDVTLYSTLFMFLIKLKDEKYLKELLALKTKIDRGLDYSDNVIAIIASSTMPDFLYMFKNKEERAMEELKKSKIDLLNDVIVYRNLVLYFYSISPNLKTLNEIKGKVSDIETQAIYNTVDYNAVSFAVLITGIASMLGEMFTLYDQYIESYLNEERVRKFKKLNFLIRKASLDFSDFYDVEVITRLDLRELFEMIKTETYIDDMYESLRKRLDFFAKYESDRTGHEISERLVVLTIVLLAFTSISLIQLYFNVFERIAIESAIAALLMIYTFRKVLRELSNKIRKVRMLLFSESY
ncbi:hypothetical protein [Saccharolobus caldissimus]|uniref:Uncharacterized protein n=1 Tax=Saccharolobus caldissimus TaxID=1702097 RepID=A0AAQ4CRS3_9CREN|nr:hypothetical protein [Saccharolobus caldissimus]BDB98504.1 hypothetical protein SACC_15210 [Saccharolobus caldissimus]